MLQSLLNTHTTDDIELYCDNQGCVNIWDRMTVQHDAGSGPDAARRGNYAAMWNRIDRLRRDRARKGSSTVMNWIQSHVQDKTKRVSTSSNIECACRAASGDSKCTMPGDECHWLHEGNDEADRLAKLSKDMSEITSAQSGLALQACTKKFVA